MITLKTNIGVISERIKEKLGILADKEYLLRPVCFDVIDLMTKRIHVDGKDSDNTDIGTYSKGYMSLRTGTFKRLKKKDGTDIIRPKYNRTTDTKVVISLTRQLENDWSVIATEKGYGIGFLNEFNMQKARWTEGTYSKKIFNLSEAEQDHAISVIQDLTRKALE